MLTRRGFASCALCALTGFAATPVAAEGPAPAGIKREILKRMDGPTPDYETIIAAAEIAPGFIVPRHIHPGIESAYIVEGGGCSRSRAKNRARSGPEMRRWFHRGGRIRSRTATSRPGSSRPIFSKRASRSRYRRE